MFGKKIILRKDGHTVDHRLSAQKLFLLQGLLKWGDNWMDHCACPNFGREGRL